MLITMYKTLHGVASPNLKSVLEEWKMAYNLRHSLKLNIPGLTTTSFGLQSFRYAAPQVWNMLPDDLKTSLSLIVFKCAIDHTITV